MSSEAKEKNEQRRVTLGAAGQTRTIHNVTDSAAGETGI